MLLNAKKFIIYQNRECLLFGALNIDAGCLKEGDPVYYDTKEDKFVLEYFGTQIAYYYNSLKKFVTQNQYSDAVKVITENNKLPGNKFDIEKWKQEPEPNFHY